MNRICALVMCVLLCPALSVSAPDPWEKDVVKTSAGDLEITFIGHGSLMMAFSGKTIYVDPFGKLADFQKFLKADLVLLTHHHGDHLDVKTLDQLVTEKTTIFLTRKCADEYKKGVVMKNGDVQTVFGITVEAVPAYNLIHKRPDGSVFHPKGEGNG